MDIVARIEAYTNAQSVEALWALHVETMAGFGFDRLIYGFTRYRSGRSLGDPQDWIILSTLPRDYMAAYIDKGLYFDGPMLRWGLENDGACSWSWMRQQAEAGALTPRELKVMEYNRQTGVQAGYTLSFRSLSERHKGGIGLIAPVGISQAEVDAAWDRHGAVVQTLNNVWHLKVTSLPHLGQRHLTSRQREVLQWVGDGKTAQDIATIMGLTAATVEKHLRLAREALDVDTTAQAVMKAAFQNQMFVVGA